MDFYKRWEFVQELCYSFLKEEVWQLDAKSLMRYGRVRGWLEDEDESFYESSLIKKDAARILHHFMQLELSIADLQETPSSKKLADLYNCHSCVNHIEQLYERKIMTSVTLERDGKKYELFNHLEELKKTDGKKLIENLQKII